MRIPLRKVYRAFPELDRFTDDQCERLMRRVQLHGAAQSRVVLAMLGGGVAGVVVAAAFNLTLWPYCLAVLMPDVTPRDDLLRVGPQMLLLGIAAAAGSLFTRDHALRTQLVKAIHIQLERVRCPNCQYILIGQRAQGDMVECPECGERSLLRRLGLTPADLIPPTAGGDPLERV